MRDRNVDQILSFDLCACVCARTLMDDALVWVLAVAFALPHILMYIERFVERRQTLRAATTIACELIRGGAATFNQSTPPWWSTTDAQPPPTPQEL